ncbi:MAG: retropepsin-like aspartic protease [Bacteroidales bacterium]
MKELQVKCELFILECSEHFEDKTIKTKMIEVVKRGTPELKEWFYRLGTDNDLPTDWDSFKKEVINFCTGKDIQNVTKYRDEQWSAYISRVQDFINLNKIEDEKALKRIRSLYLPKFLQLTVYSVGISLQIIFERAKEQEDFRSTKKQNIEKEFAKNRPKQKFNNELICFKCKKQGSYANNCPTKRIYNVQSKHTNNKDIDSRYMILDKTNHCVIFDTGASNSFICSGALKYILNKSYMRCSKTWNLIDGSKIKAKRCLEIEIGNDRNKINEVFYIVENPNSTDIIIGNNTIAKIKGYREIPVVCAINTKDCTPISWTKPIKVIKIKKTLTN